MLRFKCFSYVFYIFDSVRKAKQLHFIEIYCVPSTTNSEILCLTPHSATEEIIPLLLTYI